MKYIGFLIFILLFNTGSFAQSKLSFSYQVKKDSIDKNIMHVDAKIVNKGNTGICFLSESCNGLDYYISCDNADVQVWIFFNCNATYPVINNIGAGSEYKFETHLRLNPTVSHFSLQLKLFLTDCDYSAEGKNIGDIQSDNSLNMVVISGPEIDLSN